MSGDQNVPKVIDYVKEKIELCTKTYMSLEQTMTYLYEHDQIDRRITVSIWQQLRMENPNFFGDYNKRCEVVRQIVIFNDLLSQQNNLMQTFRPVDLSATNTTPVTKLHEPNDQDQIHDQCSEYSNDFAHIEDSFLFMGPIASSDDSISSVIIDPSSFAATPHSDLLTSLVVTPQSDSPEIDVEQIFREIEEQQQRLELKAQIQQQQLQQQLMDQQQVCYPQQQELLINKTTNLQQASNNLDFGVMDPPTRTMAQIRHIISEGKTTTSS